MANNEPSTSHSNHAPPTGNDYFNELPPGQLPIFASRGRIETVHCMLCDAIFTNRKALHTHRVRTHKMQLGGADLQDVPFSEDEDPFEQFPEGEEMGELYQDSELYILEPNILDDPVFKSFNFPINGTIDNEEVKIQMREIYNDPSMSKSYKLDIAVGFIMKSTEDNSLRYFKPSGNAYILDDPLVIDSRETLEASIRYLVSLDLDEMVRSFRPSTKYQVLYITQIMYHCWLTDFALGSHKAHDFLPRYVTSNKYIDTSFDYKGFENCCAFICLAQHRKLLERKTSKHNTYNSCLTRVKASVKRLVRQWRDYCFTHEIPGYPYSSPSAFEGLQWEHIEHFEHAFKVQVHIMELQPDGSVETRYKSVASYDEHMHVNLHKDHLNLILNVKLYAKKFRCRHCMAMFKKKYLAMRHERTCSCVTNYIFPSGAYRIAKTVFEELEEFGIVVPRSNRNYQYYMIYDMEAVLKPIEKITKSGKTKFIEQHVPISCSISSNIEPFTKPHCIIHSNPHEIVKQMFTHFDKIRIETNKLAHYKWGVHLERLEEMIQQRFSLLQNKFSAEHVIDLTTNNTNDVIDNDICTEDNRTTTEDKTKRKGSRLSKFVAFLKRDMQLCNMIRVYKRFFKYIYRTVILSFNGQKYDVHLISSYMIKHFLDSNGQVSDALIKHVSQSENIIDLSQSNTRNIQHSVNPESAFGDDAIALNIDVPMLVDDSDDSDSDNESEYEYGTDPTYSESSDDSDYEVEDDDDNSIDTDYEYEQVLGGFDIQDEHDIDRDEWSMTIDELLERDKMEQPGELSVLKRNNCYVHFGNNNYIMLDVSNWLSPGSSYSRFLSAYGVREKKFFFPYGALSSVDDLNSWIPEYNDEGWKNKLKNNVHIMEHEYDDWEKNGRRGPRPKTGQENYKMFKETCDSHNIKTMRQLLELYNNMDVGPFIKGVQNMLKEYEKMDLDIFKDSFGTPGLSRRMLMRSAQRNNTFFPLFNKENCDLYFMFKKMSTGGPAIIFTRHAEVGKTYLRPDKKELVRGIEGYDANAMYLSVLRGNMPTTMFVRRKARDNFKPVYRKNYLKMIVWLEMVAEETGEFVRSKASNGYETRALNYLLDGLIVTKSGKLIALEFLGCVFHEHSAETRECPLANSKFTVQNAYQKWKKKKTDLEQAGYEVRAIWECDFNKMLKQNPKYKKRYNELKPPFLKKYPFGEVSEDTIIRAIKNGDFFGFVLVDIKVPSHLRPMFDIMPPIFANHTISFDQWSDNMKKHAKQQGIGEHGRRLLVSGFEAKEILLNEDLAKYYLQLNMEIVKIHECIEFTPRRPFQEFAEQVTANRLAASRGKNRQIVGELFKLIGTCDERYSCMI